jgi:hypothetical protein
MVDAQAFAEDERRQLVERYDACRTVNEKRALARELGMPVEALYNLWSRWSRRPVGAS